MSIQCLSKFLIVQLLLQRFISQGRPSSDGLPPLFNHSDRGSVEGSVEGFGCLCLDRVKELPDGHVVEASLHIKETLPETNMGSGVHHLFVEIVHHLFVEMVFFEGQDVFSSMIVAGRLGIQRACQVQYDGTLLAPTFFSLSLRKPYQ